MIDAHMHATEGKPSEYSDYDSLSRMVSCVAKPDEWEAQSGIDDPRLVKSYGVHPWYADLWDDGVRSELESILASDPGAMVGEIGLDSKRGTVREQIPAFEAQLDIASKFRRVVSIHDIGCEKEVLEALRCRDMHGVILHSYGSDSYVKPFTEIGCYFSISPRLLSRSAVRVKRLFDALPKDRVLFETDSPNFGKGFTGMGDFLAVFSETVSVPAEDLETIAEENLRRLLG